MFWFVTKNALVLFAGPQDVPYVYCLFYVIFVPLRWIYYRYKKWHYYLLVSPIIFQFFRVYYPANVGSTGKLVSAKICLFYLDCWLDNMSNSLAMVITTGKVIPARHL